MKAGNALGSQAKKSECVIPFLIDLQGHWGCFAAHSRHKAAPTGDRVLFAGVALCREWAATLPRQSQA
jgi:hypothetical protein